MADKEQSNIQQEYNNATVGLNMDQTSNQIKKGCLTYALNAAVENFDANGITYQNEESNELCLEFPQGYALIGKHFIAERNKHIFFLANADLGTSQIGYMDNNDCEYKIYIDNPCLGFDVNHPIHKIVHKITNCSTELFWAQHTGRKHLDIDNIPKTLQYGTSLCDPKYTDQIDCNQLKLQPNFSIPKIEVVDVISGGNQTSGTVQFAVQYADAVGNPYTSYYSHTNPTPIADVHMTSVNFNFPVGKSVVIDISNLDTTGYFQYFNLSVIKTVNTISSPELIGTYYIDAETKRVIYTGQNVSNIRLSIDDIFEKFPYYDIAEDVTAVQDILVWDQLTAISRVNYQKIWSKVRLQWETWRIPAGENYADELNATNLRTYLRDEVYPYEGVFLLTNGRETDSFHIPGRAIGVNENKPDILASDPDFIGEPDTITNSSPYWKIYNTASVTGFSPSYKEDPSYKGPYQFGEFAYWESTEEYPCNKDVWGDLAGQKIRHHKFPDVLVSPIYESKIFYTTSQMVMGNDATFPIGVKIDVSQIESLIRLSELTPEQKADIIGFKIVRGDRGTNKSIIAKGILRNVGTYTKEQQDFYYPNYPYNDLNTDPFLNATNNAFSQICKAWEVSITELGSDPNGEVAFAEIEYTDCNTNKTTRSKLLVVGTSSICSISRPIIISPAKGTAGYAEYERWFAKAANAAARGYRVEYEDVVTGVTQRWISGGNGFSAGDPVEFHVVLGTGGVKQIEGPGASNIWFYEYHPASITCGTTDTTLSISSNENLAYRQIFNSPETSFGQPFLGNTLKLESVMFGAGKAHFVEVKNNAKYKLLTEEAQRIALASSERLAAYTNPFNATAMFTAYQAYLTIYVNGITRKNYAYSFNSIADYNYGAAIPNDQGIKQRPIDIARYLIPGVQSVGDTNASGESVNINNYQRESSVFLRTDINKTALPYPDKTSELTPNGTSIVEDISRFTISGIGNCNSPAKEQPIQVVSYYASLKNQVGGQWGQVYSYETIDTGYQVFFKDSIVNSSTVFGGDTFIGRFAFKTKVPFFIDNRVNAPDDSDIFYDEIGNIAYPKYWHSARSILKDYTSGAGVLSNIISYKAHNFDCPNDGSPTVTVVTTVPIAGTTSTTSTTSTTTTRYKLPGSSTEGSTVMYYDGYFYLFAYGVPSFYCESSYNLDLRQAFNNKEGDFWSHVSTGIPDDWVQESFVPIAQDNTYYYNTTYSKQNKENTFTHLPIDWDKPCRTNYPFRAIYSDSQNVDADNRVNAWLTYRAASYFDFPQNYGSLTSLDGIQNRAILARFENKSLLYNNLLTIDTSNPQAAYVGNPKLFKGAPPIDFAETDLGYVGSQHKLLLKIPQGQISIDAKRGQIFLISGTQAIDLSAPGSGMNRFFTDHLAFEIIKWYPDVDVDNNFTGVGLHAVYDSKYDRIIITKLDYIPIRKDIKYDYETREFYTEKLFNNFPIRNRIYLTDVDSFCNKSWTISYNMNTKSWISFHSYIPNWYIGENNFFYSGVNGGCDQFDFIVGVSVPIPTSTTTTTTTILCATDFDVLSNYIIPSIEFIDFSCVLSQDIVFTTSTTTTTTTNPSELCLDCPPGYTATVDGCYIEDIVASSAPANPQTLSARTNRRYGTIGTVVFGTGWNYDGTGPTYNHYFTGNFWANPAIDIIGGTTTDGIMNQNAVWSGATIDNQIVGFPICFELAEAKTYYMGLGCDNYAEIKIDGVSVLMQDPTALYSLYTANAWSIPSPAESTFRLWFIYPIHLSAGKHIVELIGHNDTDVAAVGLDVYDISETDLMACNSYADIGSRLVFSTKDEIGSLVKIGNNGQGYSCPEGYVLGYCDDNPMCYKIDYLGCGEPAPTTTTSSTTQTSTTTTTTTTIPVTTTTTTTETPGPITTGIELQFSTLTGLDTFIGGDIHDINVWNTYLDATFYIFDPPTGVSVVGNSIVFTGASSMVLKPSAFLNNTNLIGIVDHDLQFIGLSHNSLENCTGITTLNIPVASSIGESTGLENVFAGIAGNTINYYIYGPFMSLVTGDADFMALQANNTVTIITV